MVCFDLAYSATVWMWRNLRMFNRGQVPNTVDRFVGIHAFQRISDHQHLEWKFDLLGYRSLVRSLGLVGGR